MQPDAARAEIEGIVYYEPMYVLISQQFTRLANKDGVIIGSAPTECREAVVAQEVRLVPDLRKPMVLNYEKALLEGMLGSRKFSVTLANGMLVTVNSEATSDLPELVSAGASVLSGLAALRTARETPASEAAAGPNTLCNTGLQITGKAVSDLTTLTDESAK